MNLPNKITLSRIALAFIFMFLLFCQGITARYLALVTFCLACLTDFLDGHIARRRKLENDFGRLMDPIADKILILAAFLALNNLFRNIYVNVFNLKMEILPAWMVIIILFRELVITGLRLNIATRGKVLSASLAGKHKTASQMAAIISILVFLIIRELATDFWNPVWESWFRWSVFCLMLITVILTLISGVSYLIRNKNILFTVNEKTD